MAPLSLKVVLDEGAVTRTLKFESTTTVAEAQAQVKEKILTGDDGKVYGLFLTSADDERSGIWLEGHRQLDYYMLRDGDQLHYLCRIRNLRVRMLDGSVRTLQVDESKTVEELMKDICARIGITNHDEYGLCHDRDEQDENKLPAGTGTLTLKRMAHKKERDAKLEQLSKKIKTDDNVEWLEQKSTLRELGAGDAPLLLKRRLFYSDRNVDARDPVQLNLLYVQARDAILEGRHPVTEDQAVEFAGIQCQVHYGDFEEDKHKPGFIENLNEFLPEQYSSSWGVEKKILKEYRKHPGLSAIEAKHLYTKTARDLPTYGVTFFLVKEKQKGKKKLVPRLLGINAESILRLDEVTKEILQAWPLTQVKTYHAGKAETFTLNFGDYSDKEYSVKTNDAHRIRDILQGYIDLIRRRMEAKWSADHAVHHAVGEEYVEASRGHIMEHIQHNPKALVQETFVGPSKIISYEPGQQITQGTQIMTVQQIVVTGKGSNHQNVMVGEVPMRKDMSIDFVRKLNRLNSNSVKVVTFLAEPSEGSIEEARILVKSMEGDMPSIIEGVEKSAAMQTNEDARKKLLDELEELRDAMKSLVDATQGNKVNPEEGEDAAKRIADLSTQMYFSLDPRTVKRGELCRRSRNSFIRDDKLDATLRRASVISAAQLASGAVDNALTTLDKSYEGPVLGASAVDEVGKAAEDKIGKLNAAVALYLTAYADPKNVDYSAAVTSMNTINELLPELTKDAMMLSGVKDGTSRQELLDQIRALCDAAKRVCQLTDPEDHEKIQQAANNFGRVSEKLLFTFRRSRPDKSNELVDLAKDVGHKTSLLVAKAKELSSLHPEPTEELDEGADRCADAAKDLLACATVTAPSIHEPHCQSALTAAAETLSSSAQHLALCWKPLVEDPSRKHVGDDLRDQTIDLAKALDRLKAAFAGLNGTPGGETDDDQIKKGQKLKFITTIGNAKKIMNNAEEELIKPITGAPLDKSSSEELQRKLAQRIAQLNAALAALVAATSDRNNPDYKTADLAVTTITELMPNIVKDGKALSASKDDKSRDDLLRNLKALCDATNAICEASEHGGVEALNTSASKFAATSGKLVYVFNPSANQNKEHEVMDISSVACEKASEMLASVYQLASEVDPDASDELDVAGSKVADAANALLTSAQLTSPCIDDPRCQATLISSANGLSSFSQQLASIWTPLVQDKKYADLGKKLEVDRQDLEKELERLRNACQVAPSDVGFNNGSGVHDQHRLQFTTSAAAAKKQVEAVEKELNKPVVAPKGKVSSAELQQKLYAGVAQLNAAVAALVAATADREKPDFEAADNAMNSINQLLPQIVKDMKTISAGVDEKSRAETLAELRALCEAARGICESAGTASNEELNKSAVMFANSSGKLVFVFNPRSNQDKQNEILDITSSACEKASELLNDVYQLAAEAEGEAGSNLDLAGAKMTDAANALLTTAQLTAPCVRDPRCVAALVASASALSAAARPLAAACAARGPLDPLAARILGGRGDLEDELERLRRACGVGDGGRELQQKQVIQDPRHLKFIKSAVATDNQLQQIEKELNKPTVPLKSGQTPAHLQNQLAESLARLNAAIAALLQATADRENPDYDAAEQSLRTINQLMPQVVKDTKALSATKDEHDRKAMLDDLKEMFRATRGVCASVRDDNHENLNYNAVRFGSNSGKLFYVVSPHPNQPKEHEIIELSSQACERATMLLTEVYQLAADVGGDTATELDAAGSRTADAAKTLLATAQLTAPSIHEQQCQATLLSAANGLSSSAKYLASTWAAPVQDPAHAAKGAQLATEYKELGDAVERLKAALREDTSVKSPTRHAPPPPPPKRISSHEHHLLGHAPRKDVNQEFLDRLRHEESHNASTALAQDIEAKNKRKTDDEKTLHQEFVKNLDSAALKIKKSEDDVNRIYSARDEVIPALSVDQTLVVQKQMEQKLASAGVAASNLVASSHPDSIDLAVASKSATTLTDLMPQIVQDAKLLRGSLNDEERKRFLADILALFEATKNMLQSAKEDRKKLDLSAVEFGNKSAKLFYVVSTDVDPSQEKEVLERVRNINESASRLAILGADSTANMDAQQMHALCQVGGKCAEAATALAYTAKLVAPAIQHAECNEVLTKASNDLSSHIQSYSSSWKPLEGTPQIEELKTEAASLEKLLEELRRDLASGKLVKRRTVERVVVEDTPMRKLACVVQEEAKRRAESTVTSPDLRVKYANYANELGQAIKQLDLAYHRCRQSPHDPEKRQDLEYAVQNLQITLLQTRPSLDGRPQNNIVDLTEYVKEVANDADLLKKQCRNGQPEILSVLETIKQHCEEISNQAAQLTTTESYDKTDEAGWMEIEQFAEDCDNRLNGINYLIEGLHDGKLKIDLQEKTTRLSEDCNMLRFATKCALASSQGVSLDATLDDLTDLEAKIDEMLAQGEKSKKKLTWSEYGRTRLIEGASRACAGVSSDLPPATAAYVDDVRASTDLSDERDRARSKDHLHKVMSLLKALAMTTSRHVATWQKLGHPEIAEITHQILQELDSHQNHVNTTKGKAPSSVLSEVDLNKLLFPTQVKVQGDQKQISDKLQQEASKLSTITSTIMQSAHKPESLARSVNTAALAATSLAAYANALRTSDLAQSQKIDEATNEMSLQTYNMLKTADLVSQEPNNIASRRRLLHACRMLNDAINKLVRQTTPANRLHRECAELSRSLQLRLGLLQAAPLPASALHYADCVDALHNQSEVIQKLSNDSPMSREEFGRTLGYVSSAVCNTTEHAAQCAYLISIADQNKEIAIEGFIDTSRIKSLSEAVQESCHRIIRTDVEQAKAEELVLNKQVQDLQQAVIEAHERTSDKTLKDELSACAAAIDNDTKALCAVVGQKTPDRAKLTTYIIHLLDSVKSVNSTVEAAALAPEVKNVSTEAKARSDDILKNSRALNNNMLSLIREVKAHDDQGPMTWVTFGTSRKAVLDMFEALLNSVKENGKRAGILEPSHSDIEEDADQPRKSYVHIQLDLANKWLRRPTAKADAKTVGEEAAWNIIKLGELIAEDLKGNDKEELLQLTQESKALLNDCLKKYDSEKASALMERLKELRKNIERGVVTRVVEDLLEGDEPFADLDILADAEKDESKRKFLLERKIAELLAHLGRVGRAARLVAGAGSAGPRLREDLLQCSRQTELLAPMLVKAAQQRVTSPDDKAAIEHYQKLLAQYAESLANVRNLCDQAVDPMDFVQTAGETMQRMREDTHDNDPQKCAYASTAITKLANRVINVSLSSADVRKDPELQKLLQEAKEKLKATAPPPNARPSRIPDWKVTTAEILRTTGEVESVLGGEMIFNKQQGTDQPIFAAARDLHSAVRGWSARDNDIVAVARRMAVLMAKLSDHMLTDRKRDVLVTSKAIVSESHEVAELARKLAHECTDVRIKSNLLQVCERIPTISGQLKMLATVKGSSLGHQGLKEDQEDMITLVGNAQNLMSSVQEVVKAAASASVKIASQRGGPRMRWVRKNYY